MTIERTYSGIRISDIVGDQWISELYIGYTKTEAVRMFKRHIKTLKQGVNYV